MRILVWLIRAFIFLTLFAFALNNQQPVAVHWFFGFEWRAPMVIVVLLSFAAGATIGVLAMLPPLWRRQRSAAHAATDDASEARRRQRSEQRPQRERSGGPASVAPVSQPPREAL